MAEQKSKLRQISQHFFTLANLFLSPSSFVQKRLRQFQRTQVLEPRSANSLLKKPLLTNSDRTFAEAYQAEIRDVLTSAYLESQNAVASMM
jgi:hypothetical protein